MEVNPDNQYQLNFHQCIYIYHNETSHDYHVTFPRVFPTGLWGVQYSLFIIYSCFHASIAVRYVLTMFAPVNWATMHNSKQRCELMSANQSHCVKCSSPSNKGRGGHTSNTRKTNTKQADTAILNYTMPDFCRLG